MAVGWYVPNGKTCHFAHESLDDLILAPRHPSLHGCGATPSLAPRWRQPSTCSSVLYGSQNLLTLLAAGLACSVAGVLHLPVARSTLPSPLASLFLGQFMSDCTKDGEDKIIDITSHEKDENLGDSVTVSCNVTP
jgi:hypothetical protein